MTDPKIVKVISAEGKTRVYEMDDGTIVERKGGHANWRNNNPGNLKFELPDNASEETKLKRLKEAQGRYDGIVGLDENGMAIFETAEAGRLAQIKLADRKASEKPDWTLEDYVKFYAKDDYAGKANHAAYLKKVDELGKQNGVDLSKDRSIASLNEREKSVLVDAMKQVEGSKIGDTRTLYTPNSDYQLKFGDSNKDVEGLRASLAKAGYQTFLDTPGYYGYATYEAVRRFQKDNGLPETGTADMKTLDVLGKKVGANTVGAPLFMRSDNAPQDTPNSGAVAIDGDNTGNHNKKTPRTETGGALLSDESHPNHAMYRQALSRVTAIQADAEPPMPGDPKNLAAAATAAAVAAGMTRIDSLSRSDDGKRLFAVQGDDPSMPQAKYARIDIDQAAQQPLAVSSRQADVPAQDASQPFASQQAAASQKPANEARDQDTLWIRPLAM